MQCPGHMRNHVLVIQAPVTLEAAVIVAVRALSSVSPHVNKAAMTAISLAPHLSSTRA